MRESPPPLEWGEREERERESGSESDGERPEKRGESTCVHQPHANEEEDQRMPPLEDHALSILLLILLLQRYS